MPPYKSIRADTNIDFDVSSVKNRTVIVTGGAKGLGAGYVRSLVKAGAYVAFGDVDREAGEALALEFSPSARFVPCDVTVWSDQLALFKEAVSLSPNGVVDAVVANAGIGARDSIYEMDVKSDELVEPQLRTFSVNLIGVIYTTKLALHYFRQQHVQNEQLDQVLILGGSMAGYLNTPAAIEYGISKYGLRSLMTNLRLTEWQHNIRINFVGPWFVETTILPPDIVGYIKSKGAQFATTDDANEAILRIIADPTIAGRTFAILPRTLAPRGYLDVDSDDFAEGHLLGDLQREYNRSFGM